MPHAAASPDDHRQAAELATEAGKLLVDLRAELVASGAEAAELKAEGDRRSNVFLMERLADLYPADAILSEEGKDEQGAGGTSRLDAERVWVVDPSTAPASSPTASGRLGRPRGPGDRRPAGGRGGALPAQHVTLMTSPPPPMPPDPPAQPRVIVSRSGRLRSPPPWRPSWVPPSSRWARPAPRSPR